MKHVIVTGGSRGLGAAFTVALLRAGYRVSTGSRTITPFIQELQAGLWADRFQYTTVDMADTRSCEEFFAKCLGWGGGLFALVNNAGTAQAGVLATFPNVESEKMLRVNLLAPIALSRLAAGQFLKQRSGGRIINISSIIGSRGYNGLSAYSATKAGLDGLTRSLARELGRLKVTVNSIAPGYLETEMSAKLSADQLEQIKRRTPLGRIGATEDVTGLLLFLLSDAAAFITGQTILVDGGVSC